MQREGLLIVVSAPSGTGKGTVLDYLRQKNANIRYSVSATTRKPRQGEVEGINYFYKSEEEFKRMIEDEELLEWVQYVDNYYGTPKTYVEKLLKDGYDVVLELEVIGALNIMKKYPGCVSIFILPPSFVELKRRIEGRGTEKPEVIEKRLVKAGEEIRYVEQYSYAVINDTVEKAAEDLKSIISAEKLKVERNKGILGFLGV